MPNKQHKSKISKIEDDVFEIGAVKHASQFSKSLQNVADYVQIKYNSDMAEAIRTMEEQVFIYPDKPTVTYVKDESGKETEIKPDESDYFM